MRISERLNRIESKVPTKQSILVVKYGNELRELNYCGDLYKRYENETEQEFVSRILGIVEENPKQNGHYLVGNMD